VDVSSNVTTIAGDGTAVTIDQKASQKLANGADAIRLGQLRRSMAKLWARW
jgi:hypothetical protein